MTIPPEVLNAIPSKWVVYGTAAWVALQAAGRVYHAIRSDGGLLSIYRGLIYGDITPPQKKDKIE